jgi:hypothetical protein
MTGKQELTRLSVNLTPKAHAAMKLAARLTGDTQTNTVNRAVQVYAYFENLKAEGADILVRRPGMEPEKITWF